MARRPHVPPPEERLLKLTAWLLTRRQPVSFEEIRQQFSNDYDGSEDAVEKKWTRDKQSLIQAGVPIQHVEGDGDHPAGYLVDPHAYYLPEGLSLAPEEIAVLWTAGRAALGMGALPWHAELASALRKLQCVAAEPAPAGPPLPRLLFGPPVSPETAEVLERLGQAVRRRKRVHLHYLGAARQQETERNVDVYGFAWRRGTWLFAGHCHLRAALRVFYVSRVRELTVSALSPSQPDYEIPEDFDVRAFSAQQPWEYWFGERQKATVRLTGALAPLAASLVPGARVEREADAALATVEVRDVDALVRHVLTLGESAEILSPPAARRRARQMLERVAAEHGGER